MKQAKGEPGYINRHKKAVIIKAVVEFGIVLFRHYRIGDMVEQDIHRTIGVAQHLGFGNGSLEVCRQRLMDIDTIGLIGIFVISQRIVGCKTKSIRTQTDG